MNQLIIGVLLSIVPIIELKGSIPLIVEYSLRNNINYLPYVTLAILSNILIVFLVFLFLDFIHFELMRIKAYNKFWKKVIENKMRKKIDEIRLLEGFRKYFALFLFVLVPIPGTGVWSGVLMAWTLGFERFKAFITICLAGVCSGILILLISLGIIGFF